ncbi:hypothetical protein ABDD95_06545 [Mucilaginibacter sp. PAMB04274]|uniref:hypothetical protein n=1 Tax=Mucilaginibacter sp. PAMB04274 TaxID=3138568 RepID=UPI0031F70922
MKYLFVNLLLSLTVLSCTSGRKDNAKADSTNAAASVSNTGPFDLATLTLKEKNAPGLIAARKVKPEPVSDVEQTLLGYEVLKSSNANVLRFGGKDLSGANGTNKNHVLFHYDDQTKALAFYVVALYTQQQADALLKELEKMGKPQFEKIGLDKGEVALDLNGDPIERGKEQKQAYRVWENKKNRLTYFFGELGSGKDFEAELTVLDRSAKYAKDWISFDSLDWYKK